MFGGPRLLRTREFVLLVAGLLAASLAHADRLPVLEEGPRDGGEKREHFGGRPEEGDTTLTVLPRQEEDPEGRSEEESREEDSLVEEIEDIVRRLMDGRDHGLVVVLRQAVQRVGHLNGHERVQAARGLVAEEEVGVREQLQAQKEVIG